MKNIGLLFYILSAVFNVTGIVMFARGGENNMGFVWVCLGSTFLCLGTALSRKKEEEKQE